jgi:hypothetical protein
VSTAAGPALQARENAWVDAYRRTLRTKPVGLESDAHGGSLPEPDKENVTSRVHVAVALGTTGERARLIRVE